MWVARPGRGRLWAMLEGTSKSLVSEVMIRSGLPEGTARAALMEAIEAASVCGEQLEASVRWAGGRGLRGGRVMIERASYSLFLEVLSVFGGAPSPRLADLALRAEREGLPLIVGWDASLGAAKLYLNGSDASEVVRRRLWEGAGLCLPLVPHLLAFNVGPGAKPGCKAYLQSANAMSLAEQHGDQTARVLTSRADALGVVAGGVMCWDVDESTARPRGFFVAIRDDDARTWEGLTDLLPGWNPHEVDAALPFERGSMRSIGVGSHKAEWTAYFKPRGVGAHLWSLEPVACYGMPGVEVGVFVEPNDRAARARERTRRFALNCRVRRGIADEALVDRLMRWVLERVSAAEEDGDPSEATLSDPPAPWTRVR